MQCAFSTNNGRTSDNTVEENNGKEGGHTQAIMLMGKVASYLHTRPDTIAFVASDGP